MNKYKKEEIRKYSKARIGLANNQIAVVDLEDILKKEIENLTKEIHFNRFPEEYDFMLDSIADANIRENGINPMSEEYIEKAIKKRHELGVSQLSNNGMSVSKDSCELCEIEARKQIFSNLNTIRPPSKKCIFCNKTIEEIGGKRLTAQKTRGICLSQKLQSESNNDYPRTYIKLFDDLEIYMTVWGKEGKWTKSTIDKAKNEYLNGYQPWFCQICGKRACDICGSPQNYPAGSDILYSDGSTSHFGIFPYDHGCSNPDCEKYKKQD